MIKNLNSTSDGVSFRDLNLDIMPKALRNKLLKLMKYHEQVLDLHTSMQKVPVKLSSKNHSKEQVSQDETMA